MNHVFCAILIAVSISITVQAKYSGGLGQANDPYQIANRTDLLALADDVNDYNKCFILTSDIDLDPNLPDGQVFTTSVLAKPIKNGSPFVGDKFSGIFDGAGHKISNLTIDNNIAPIHDYIGLFGSIHKAEVKNLELSNVIITGTPYSTDYIGGLAGSISDSNISDCNISVNISSESSLYVGGLAGNSLNNNIKDSNIIIEIKKTSTYTGGMIGSSINDVISNCQTAGVVYGYINYFGGLLGTCENGIITNCSSSCTVTGGEDTGGLIGSNSGTITNCFTTGYVNGGSNLGGFVGTNSGVINDCYSLGNVDADYGMYIGGFAGRNSGIIFHCYSLGNLRADDIYNIGGFVGYNDNNIINSYAKGSVYGFEGSNYLGGFSGENDGNLSSCFCTGDVRGGFDSWVSGGFAGFNSGNISNCFSTGNASSDFPVGGLIGKNYGNIINCYSIGIVDTAIDYTGGLVGQNDENIEDSYFLTSSGHHNGFGKPLTKNQMRQQHHFKTWDFTGETLNGANDIWMMFEDVDYPKLAWSFDGNCPIFIKKCSVIARDENYNSILITGKLNADNNDFLSAQEVKITIDSQYQFVAYMQSFGIYSGGTFINNKFRSEIIKYYLCPGCIGKISFKYDTKTKNFFFKENDADVWGFSSPMKLQIDIGDYNAVTTIDESIVNGRKPIPIKLLTGLKDSIRIDNSRFSRDANYNIIRFSVKGGISLKNVEDANLCAVPLDINIGSNAFIIPAGSFKYIKGKYVCSNVLLSNSEVAWAIFDFNRCTFYITISNTNIRLYGSEDFKIEFCDFSEQAEVLLP